ncbi:hypothetical protein ACTNEW_10840 [Blautia sp. HCP3S3_G3]|uniref:hypothetical protein n=1 Tax=Blautia sp. HCP3S3_G3 TaxID=3438913 RepID=UPI003F88E7BD
MGKSVIHEVTQMYRQIEKKLPQDFSGLISSGYRNRSENGMRVLFREEASEELFQEISWGEVTRRNRKEQAGILAGHFCWSTSGEEQIPWVEVCHVIPCVNPQESGEAFIRMSAENWQEMYQELDRLNEEKNLELIPVGWYHTHPWNIAAVYSNIDYETQAHKCEYPYSVGVVFNPHQKTWKAYYGPKGLECESYLTMPANSIKQEYPCKNWYQASEKTKKIRQEAFPGENAEYEIFQYNWHKLQIRQDYGRRLFDRPVIERWREEPLQSSSFRNLLCGLAGALKYNLGIMGDMDRDLQGILLTGILTEEYGNYGMRFRKSFFYHDPKELLELTGRREYGKTAVLVTRKDAAFFRDNNIMWNIMTNLGIYTFVYCSAQTDFYRNRYGFEILSK